MKTLFTKILVTILTIAISSLPALAWDYDGTAAMENANESIGGIKFEVSAIFEKFQFKNAKLVSFVQNHNPSLQYSEMQSDFINIQNGAIETQIPLATFGKNVQYPGLFYNQNGNQFYEEVGLALEGNKKSKKLLWVYAGLGLAAIGGIVWVISANDDDDDDPVTETTSTTNATTTTIPTTTTTTTPEGKKDPGGPGTI